MADKWEYLSVTMKGIGGDGEVSRLGEDGWELVSVVVSEYLPSRTQPTTDAELTFAMDEFVILAANRTTAYLKRRKA